MIRDCLVFSKKVPSIFDISHLIISLKILHIQYIGFKVLTQKHKLQEVLLLSYNYQLFKSLFITFLVMLIPLS